MLFPLAPISNPTYTGDGKLLPTPFAAEVNHLSLYDSDTHLRRTNLSTAHALKYDIS